jgi:ethanolamine-phosphate cytidylyltransferase
VLPWISHYGCRYVVHGDDITSDSDGNDCYRFVKEAGRFKVVKRTPGISTTDLVGRMLLCTRNHFIYSLEAVLAGKEGDGTEEEKQKRGEDLMQRIKDYATDPSGLRPGCEVWSWRPPNSRPQTLPESPIAPQRPATQTSIDPQSTVATGVLDEEQGAGNFKQMVRGKAPRQGQRIVYVDGGYDLFSSGHIEFLRKVTEAEEELGKQKGWYTDEAVEERLRVAGEDYGPCYVVAGVHDDEVINRWKGVNYPIMNVFERSLCVLQCKVSPPR